MASQPAAKSLIGTTIAAKYLIGPLIGKGSFGEVYLATVEGSSELYAIKKVSMPPFRKTKELNTLSLSHNQKFSNCLKRMWAFLVCIGWAKKTGHFLW
jgi:serine/threonine protein kinase